MNHSPSPLLPLRRIGALLAGLIVTGVLSVGTDALMRAAGFFPPLPGSGPVMSDGLFAFAALYRVIYGILGCAVAARLTPDRPMLHALILSGVGLLLSAVGTVATWNKGPEFGPKWYPLSLIVTVVPGGWVGGLWGERLRARGTTPQAS